jgi:putative PIN family toxin of toxin-antitoxin system
VRTVLDTNVLVSAFLRGGKPKAILERAIEGEDSLFLSRDILDELREVLGRVRFKLDPEKVAYFIQALEELATIVAPKQAVHPECRDRADAIILDCALAASAQYIVSGDQDLLTLDPWRGIPILNAADYLREVSEDCPASSSAMRSERMILMRDW